mmetsp:Transcript_37864/g.55775  ORF Transcript_37864/g.55775 Transcript_37864/m.55775 type:complete len:579 (+) Transcript_37864:224-1960(+)|eukprot:CAMPEP_0195530586 /NCGR_PEP_ID=MMETSP0794_2-20130614/33556_1 /TAXON_ID=515487 /ORGANISM="Stephanopyxis turris, Strain CCMP 815" /LENGTH=578 /DNA_ID=CAMNT_0040662131 /DNA_START=204 /DNA_END=1940 /DNA_ORIENTATION=+
MQYPVQLAIYDLSQGMARSLSSQFLGPDHIIDVIPHSAVLAYNREYYFGQGIQNSDPAQFRAMHGNIQPIMVIDMGTTTLSRMEFERWCHNVASREYSTSSYDLLSRNCNNFADYALRDGLNLNGGVPDWVLDVPNRFLSSPMGAMLRPMLENMMGGEPFGGNAAGGTNTGMGMPEFPIANGSQASSADSSAAAERNPWAHIPSNDASCDNASTSHPSATTTNGTTELKERPQTPVLDVHNKPLFSSDVSTVHVCINKLTQNLDSDNSVHHDQIKSSLQTLKHELLESDPPSPNPKTVEGSIWMHLNAADIDDSEQKHHGQQVVVISLSASIMAFTFMLLRLVVLHPTSKGGIQDSDNKHQDVNAVMKSLHWVANKLVSTSTCKDADNALSYFSKSTVRAMAWCVLSNAFAHPELLGSMLLLQPDNHKDDINTQNHSTTIPSLDQIVDTAMSDLHESSSSSKEVRQAASAFLYNLLHHLTTANNSADATELPNLIVSLLCNIFEVIAEEKDETVAFRLWLVTAYIIRYYGSTAMDLILELGFGDAVLEQQHRLSNTVLKEKQLGSLVSEIASMLSLAR